MKPAKEAPLRIGPPLCTAPLVFASGGNRPRACGKPATVVLSDGSNRCAKHARGRGVKLEAQR